MGAIQYTQVTILATNTTTVDNLQGGSPLQGQLTIDSLITIPEGAWFLNGLMQLQLQVFFDTVTNTEVAKPNTERFVTPIQSQIGHWAASAGGYVLSDGRIKYARQAETWVSPLIGLSNTRQSLPIVLASTENTTTSHAQGISDQLVCGSITGVLPTLPTPVDFQISATIPGPSQCLTIVPGATELQQKDIFRPGEKLLRPDTGEFLLPDRIDFDVWVGRQVTCTYALVYSEFASTALQIAPANFITSAPQPAIYSYGCAFNNVIPSLTNPPCQFPTASYQAVPGGGGGYVLGCDQTAP